MKYLYTRWKRLLWLPVAVCLLGATPALAQDTRMDLTYLDRFSTTADKTIEVNVNEALINLAISALNPQRSPNEAKIKDILSGLKGIYVRRYEFAGVGEYTREDVDHVRSQLSGPAWMKVANVRSKRQGNFDVMLMSEGSVVRGLVVVAEEPRALTVVNVFGAIDLAKLRDLEGNFGIPNFGLEQFPGVTVKENRKDKQPDEDPDQGADQSVVVERRAEKKPPKLIRPEKPPQE
ncbi:MAG TPA: DUF4252 domain-containing protein [Blastocatellia bacterium]|jgi:hypothetical protein